MGSEGSHITQNDTPLAPSVKQQKKEGKRVGFRAKVDELEAQNNKIAMKNEFNLMENTGLFLGYRMPNYFLCNVCNTYGTINNVRMIPFWNFNYYKIHESDGTPRCNTCDRFKTTGQNEYVNLGNNQQLCSECFSTAILHPSKCKRLIENVRKFYKKLGLQVDKKIPILLIDDDELRRIHPNEQMLNVVGVTTHPPYTVMTVYVAYFWVVTDFKMFKERVMIGATLAHEMMHAWLALQG
ncbi:protein DA1-related 1-like [Malus domestica]|uniref:protein DA1-related 1-like n=1 Tax=Malus domestica TaxID=3750 RepID=UPI0039749E6E